MGVKNGNKAKRGRKEESIGSFEEVKERDDDLHSSEGSAEEETLAKQLGKRAAAKRKKERFLTSRMWLSTLISTFFGDRGVIPDNIGNNILIENNVYVTKNNITALISISEMSETTPVAWTSHLLQYVKSVTEGVTVDIVFKGLSYEPDLAPSAISGRERTWHAMMDNPYLPEEYVRRAARMLYSLDVARSNAKLYKVRIYIAIRANNGALLRQGVEAVQTYLYSIGAVHKRINSNIDEHLSYMAIMSNKSPEHLKDIPPVIFSIQTLAESMPSIQGANDLKGVMMGRDTVSGFPYYIDFTATSAAKNIMIEALSGWGKTFLASYWLYSFFASGFNLALMDIKGTEFTAITQALHGVTLSMRPTSTYYINTYVWSVDEVFDGDYTGYANERFRMSKERLLCIADLNEKDTSRAESLLESFLQYVYKSVGAVATNRNTWSRTKQLNPYVIFEMFDNYLSHEVKDKYHGIWGPVLERMRIYMSPGGSRAHMYKNAYSYADVLQTRCLTFDFGILESSSQNDPVSFHLHVMDMVCVNDAYVSYKKSRKEWTFKVLEESQVVDDWLTKVYTREITLRRAQNQVTALLGNSIAALARNPLSAPMIENINILCMGSLNKSSQKYLTDEFGLKPEELEIMMKIQVDPELHQKFLLVNRMEPNATTAILEAAVTDKIANSNLFKVVDTEESK